MRFLKLQTIFPLTITLLFFISSCSKDNNNSGLSNLDETLINTLTAAGNGNGLDAFKMPRSDDYNRIPRDSKSAITPAKVELGMFLFHETAIALEPKNTLGKGTYSCASCHHAQGGFQACLPQGIGEGGIGFGTTGELRVPHSAYDITTLDIQPIRTPSALNVAYQTNMLWNGQFGAKGVNVGTDSEWTEGTPKETNLLGFSGVETQAIAGLKVHRLLTDELNKNVVYKELFAKAFPTIPSEVRFNNINAGLAIAAYERTLLANEAPFQQWLGGNHSAMSEAEKRGAILFFGKANCGNCHSGPALNSMSFHALGMHDLDGVGVYGTDISDVENKGRGGFTQRPEDMYKFKVPQLYNLKDSPFYGHGSSFKSIEAVVEYKNRAMPENSNVPVGQLDPQFKPLGLTSDEVKDIATFIKTALYDDNLQRYVPPALPSGNCFPNSDPDSIDDLGCQ